MHPITTRTPAQRRGTPRTFFGPDDRCGAAVLPGIIADIMLDTVSSGAEPPPIISSDRIGVLDRSGRPSSGRRLPSTTLRCRGGPSTRVGFRVCAVVRLPGVAGRPGGSRGAGVAPWRSTRRPAFDEVDERLVASTWLHRMGEVAISELPVADVARRAGRRSRELLGVSSPSGCGSLPRARRA
jgi:hypothetical protein